MKRLAFLAIPVVMLTACNLATEVRFENRSAHSLDNVVLSGDGFNEQIGSLGPGEAVKVQVSPSGESGLAVTFTANGRRVSHPQAGYFEGGGMYIVSATVNADLSTDVEGRLRPVY